MIIYKEFTFNAAHFLPNVPDGHQCKRMHGHTYHLTIYFEGQLTGKEGWVLDFGAIKATVQPIIKLLDHRLLNDIPGLANPTAEILAVWLWDRIKLSLPILKRIQVKETPTCGIIYEGEDGSEW